MNFGPRRWQCMAILKGIMPIDQWIYIWIYGTLFSDKTIYEFIRLIFIGPETPAVLTATPHKFTSLGQLAGCQGRRCSMPSGWRILCQFLSTNSCDGGPLGVQFMPIPSAKNSRGLVKPHVSQCFTTAEPIKYGVKTDSPPKP